MSGLYVHALNGRLKRIEAAVALKNADRFTFVGLPAEAADDWDKPNFRALWNLPAGPLRLYFGVDLGDL